MWTCLAPVDHASENWHVVLLLFGHCFAYFLSEALFDDVGVAAIGVFVPDWEAYKVNVHPFCSFEDVVFLEWNEDTFDRIAVFAFHAGDYVYEG
ncbi:hypothetical protein [Massilibacteroides sp.]|uniref:hypothetical protein n=1 Tax=Massilibacteroides sp. TaxID=2034766 RepID=UPI002633016D|nr:hypothetical protein [Massilibacteroides sp.]MDD4515427.1 hypothetical protein [Massilibacteroides sp.]